MWNGLLQDSQLEKTNYQYDGEQITKTVYEWPEHLQHAYDYRMPIRQGSVHRTLLINDHHIHRVQSYARAI